MMVKNPLSALAMVALLTIANASCNSGGSRKAQLATDSSRRAAGEISADAFNQTVEGKPVRLYTLQNKNGLKAQITNYGGRLVALWVPDKNGNFVDVVAGFSSLEGYQKSTGRYFGATVGRYGNRIAKGRFTLDGKAYKLFVNKLPNTLHGGKKGYQDVIWDARQADSATLELSYLSKDMEEGFPGNLLVKVVFKLTDDNELSIDYKASTDKNTVVNLTNHAFFNLNGEASGSILEHQLQIKADSITPVDSTMIPTGKYDGVKNTPFDFNTATAIGARINEKHPQLIYGKGYDHNYVLRPHAIKDAVAVATGNTSGIIMSVFTTEPGLQFYSGNALKGENVMKGGHKDERRTAFCLETQHFPDSPNQSAFPSTLVKAGTTYATTTIYKFAVAK
jgi:aldose 1-epimerase